jgi:hypothetical protein
VILKNKKRSRYQALLIAQSGAKGFSSHGKGNWEEYLRRKRRRRDMRLQIFGFGPLRIKLISVSSSSGDAVVSEFPINRLYHARIDILPVNPEISSGLPIPLSNRFPQPGSRTEKYATPATKASDPAFNPVSPNLTRHVNRIDSFTVLQA